MSVLMQRFSNGVCHDRGTDIESAIERMWMQGVDVGLTIKEKNEAKKLTTRQTLCGTLCEASWPAGKPLDHQLVVRGDHDARTSRMMEEIDGYYLRKQQYTMRAMLRGGKPEPIMAKFQIMY